jgi:formylglycine-generating enzyme required for sulfatase activity
LAVICGKAMEKSAAQRYATARAFAEDLGRFLSSEAILAVPPSATERARRWMHKRRAGLSTTAAAAATLIGGFVLRDALYAKPGLVTAQLSLEDRDSVRAPSSVSYQRFDAPNDTFEAAIELSASAPWRVGLPEGLTRFTLRYADGARLELSRQVRSGPGGANIVFPVRPAAIATNEGMVLIPAGTLRRRTDYRQSQCANLDKDIRVEAFWIDQHEVTVGEFRAFLRASGRQASADFDLIPQDPALDRRPCVLVSFNDMRAYAEFYGKRLLTHSEWEWAARGSEERRTPNGAPFSANYRAAVHGQSPSETASLAERAELWRAHTRDVMSSADDVTPEGVFDMLGNVREAVESPFVDTQPKTGAAVMHETFVRLGVPWYEDTQDPMLLDNHGFDSVQRESGATTVGFRCARSASL